MEESRKRSVELVGADSQKNAEEVTAGREGSTETGREPGYSARSTTVRGSIVGREGDESPPPVTHRSSSDVGTGQGDEESRSKGTAGPTAQLDKRPKAER